MSAIITLKVDIDLTNGQPSNDLDPECQRYFKEQVGLELKHADEACKHPKVIEFINDCLKKTNEKLVSRAAHIKEFRLVSVDFSMPGGELTPTMKLKRNVTA
jgi:long-chain-fatty-acid--CoA ligase ACSBG